LGNDAAVQTDVTQYAQVKNIGARGYAVSTVGFELEQVRQYIREQESADGTDGRLEATHQATRSAGGV
jgi:hypothetical protein